MTTDEKYMDLAIKEAMKGAEIGEVPIGCVIVYQDKVIGKGYNRRKNDKTTLAHAEITAIGKACKKMGDWRLEECTLYVTLEPCQMCAGAIVQARIPRVVFASRNAKAGCAGSILNLLSMKEFNHQVEITEGVRQEECSSMLTNFFKALRVKLKTEKELKAQENEDSEVIKDIQSRLFELQDLEYRDFHAKLMPNIEYENIIGVRVPNVRALAKNYFKEEASKEFVKCLPHKYYEENNLHAFLLEQIKDFNECVEAVDVFLPYVDNWATCDSCRPKVFGKHLEELLPWIKKWLKSKNTYEVRFGIEMLMNFYLDDAFEEKYLIWVSEVKSEEYYIKMMIAWYFATALAKQYETTLSYIEEKKLSDWTHNKAIQKAVESYRITAQQKEYLRSLKVKNK